MWTTILVVLLLMIAIPLTCYYAVILGTWAFLSTRHKFKKSHSHHKERKRIDGNPT